MTELSEGFGKLPTGLVTTDSRNMLKGLPILSKSFSKDSAVVGGTCPRGGGGKWAGVEYRQSRSKYGLGKSRYLISLEAVAVMVVGSIISWPVTVEGR